MLIFKSKIELNNWYKDFKLKNITLGFVPTMGALHEGHISLVEKSIATNDFTIVSIFVNPTQFNNSSDFTNYPSTIEKDILLLEKSNCTILFLPNVEEIYSTKLESKNYKFSGIEEVMEGKYRPGHFDGVATVLSKLFNIINPNVAYLGEKDYQQLLIVKELVELEKIPLEVIGMPIYREKNGLAMSSRNARLLVEERDKASIIYETLQKAKQLFLNNTAINEIVTEVENIFLNSDFKLEYFEVRENNSLKFANIISKERKYRAFISVFAGEIKLIDNLALF